MTNTYLKDNEAYEEYKKGWNEALEEAAKMLQIDYPDNVNTNAFAAAIRSMKID